MLSTYLRVRARGQSKSHLHLQFLYSRYKSSTSTPVRTNPLGIQLLPQQVHQAVFSNPSKQPTSELLKLSKDHLQRHDLLSKPPHIANPVELKVPPLVGKTLDEHFYKLGMEAASPYQQLAKSFASIDLLPVPKEWVRRSGWTKYHPDGRTEAVEAPEEECLVFDVETLYKISAFAVMATAVSPNAWYAWLSPWVLGETKNDRQLIPLGDPQKARILVGHNVGYDRARVKEEYSINGTQTMFLDTMSLHVATNGATGKQKKGLLKKNSHGTQHNEEGFAVEEGLEGGGHWSGQSSLNSLKDVAMFHCGIEVDKSVRDQFGILDPAGVRQQLGDLLTYCAQDVAITHKVYKELLPAFLKVCPHPISFAALRHISSCVLPVNRGWDLYIANAEATYHRISDAVLQRLVDLAEEAVKLRKSPEIYNADPWLRQLDWSGQEVKQLKTKTSDSPPRTTPRKKPGMPKWYRELFPSSDAPISLTVRSRISPLLLKMAWDGHPLFWSDEHGWCFRISKRPRKDQSEEDIVQAIERYEKSLPRVELTENTLTEDPDNVYFKLPHKLGPNAKCASPLTKTFQRHFESGILSSGYALAKEALDMNAQCAYWVSARERIMEQTVVWQSDSGIDFGIPSVKGGQEVGIILPKVIPMGTVTRRASESTWLTTPPPSPERVGSEIKAMVRSPPGYVFVGADVDSEELWIASLLGDSVFGFNGANALGFMTLEGIKADGTDMHSRTAALVGVNRDGAKLINYSRIYGAGAHFIAMTLQQLNPALSEEEANLLAADIYAKTKGERTRKPTIHPRSFWRGGTESFVFNKLETFAEQEAPQTPALGAGITQALLRKHLSPREFMPTRINWVMQSSGVDYLHMLLVAMEYLCNRFNINARVALTIHDEVRYLCAEPDKYRCAMALQIANLWTRAMFSEQMGINELPLSVAWFSAIDIDTVLRKEVDMDCITPSHSTPVPPGETLNIEQLVGKGPNARLNMAIVPNTPVNPKMWPYEERKPVIDAYRDEDTSVYLKAQTAGNKDELEAVYEAEGVGAKKTKKSKNKADGVVGVEKSSEVEKHSEVKGPLEIEKPSEIEVFAEVEKPLGPEKPFEDPKEGEEIPNLIEQELLVPEPLFEESPVAEKKVKGKQALNKQPVPEKEEEAEILSKPMSKTQEKKARLAEEKEMAAKAATLEGRAEELLKQMEQTIYKAKNPGPPPPLPGHVIKAKEREKEKAQRLREKPPPRKELSPPKEVSPIRWLEEPHPKPPALLEIMPEPSSWNRSPREAYEPPKRMTRAEMKQEKRDQAKNERMVRRSRKKLEERAIEEHALRHGLPTKKDVVIMKIEIRAKKKMIRERTQKVEDALVASRDLLNLISAEVKGPPYVESIVELLPKKKSVKVRQSRLRRLKNLVEKNGPLSLTNEEAYELGALKELEAQVSAGVKQRKTERAEQLKAKRIAKQEKKKALRAEMAKAKELRKQKQEQKDKLRIETKAAATAQIQANIQRKAEATARALGW